MRSILAEAWGGACIAWMKPKHALAMVFLMTLLPLRADTVAELTTRAEAGELAAQLELADIYARGEAVAKDEAAAVRWLELASAQGDAGAQLLMGQRYLSGVGVAKDAKKGVELLSDAAVQGNPEAPMLLGSLYLSGKGVLRDSGQAAAWYQMAAEAGNPAAQIQMARMHMSGAGVAKDDVEACKWAILAGAGGDKAALRILAVEQQKLKPEQLVVAKALAAEFMERKKQERELPLPTEGPLSPQELLTPFEP